MDTGKGNHNDSRGAQPESLMMVLLTEIGKFRGVGLRGVPEEDDMQTWHI